MFGHRLLKSLAVIREAIGEPNSQVVRCRRTGLSIRSLLHYVVMVVIPFRSEVRKSVRGRGRMRPHATPGWFSALFCSDKADDFPLISIQIRFTWFTASYLSCIGAASCRSR